MAWRPYGDARAPSLARPGQRRGPRTAWKVGAERRAQPSVPRPCQIGQKTSVYSAEPGRGLAVGSFHSVPREGGRAAVRVALEVVLFFGLSLPEVTGLADLGHDLAGPVARGVDVADRLLGHLALLLAGTEDLRAVTGPDKTFAKVGSVGQEEELKQIPIGDPLRIEGDLHRLGVAAIVLLGRVVVLAAGPSHAGGYDSVAVAQQLLHDPEAPSRENRSLGVVGHGLAPRFRSSAGTTFGKPAEYTRPSSQARQ